MTRAKPVQTWTLADWEQGHVPPSLSVAETARAFGVSTYIVYRRIRAGDVPTVPHMDVARVPAVFVRRTLLEGLSS